MAIYEILASSTSEIQGITCFIIQLFIAEAMFFFHLKKKETLLVTPACRGNCLSAFGSYPSNYNWSIYKRNSNLYCACFYAALHVVLLQAFFFGYFILYNWSFYCTESWKQYSGADLYRDQNFFQDAFHGNGHWIYHCIYYLLSHLCSKNKKFSEYQPEQSPCTLGSHYFLMCLLAPSKLVDQ